MQISYYNQQKGYPRLLQDSKEISQNYRHP